MGYDHPAYLARLTHAFPALTAGSAAVSGKFIAFTALQVLAVTACLTTSGGTSTYTAWNGTATTTAIGAQTFSVVKIMNNAAAGSAPSLSTATYGPFALSLYNGTSTGTQTNSTATGLAVNVALWGTGTTGALQTGTNSGNGGFFVNQGDQLYIVQGTEATATGAYALELGILPTANVTL
jgi:hypothetical protein